MKYGLQDLVKDFHEKHGFDVGKDLQLCDDPTTTAQLSNFALALRYASEVMLEVYKFGYDTRAMRAHLMLEELGETLEAMAQHDEVRVLDGLGDLTYVVMGTGVALDLPIVEAAVEIHRSNMTKQIQPSDPDKCRLRDKGPDYVQPNLEQVLQAHRGNV